MANTAPNFARFGANALSELADMNSIFLKMEAGKPLEIVPLTGVDGILSYNQHAIWMDEGNSPMFPCFAQPWCPGEIIGDKPKFRAMMVVVTKENPDRQMVLSMGTMLYKLLLGIEDSIGSSIKGRVIKVTRTGEKLNTRYAAVPTGRKKQSVMDADVEIDLLEHLGETDPDAVVEMLKKAGIWTKAHNLQYKELRAKYPETPNGKASTIEDDEDDEIEDVEEDEDETPPFKNAAAKAPETKPAAPPASKPVDAPAKKAGKAAPAPKPAVEDEEDDDFEDIDEE